MENFWTKESLLWYEQAANNSNYFNDLAAIIHKNINKNSTISDIGSGPCFLANKLSDLGHSVYSYDNSPVVYDYMKKFQNTHFKQVDVFSMEATYFKNDVVIASHFGRTKEDYDFILNIPAKKHIIIKNKCNSNSAIGKGRLTSCDTHKYLTEHKLSYIEVSIETSLDQPLSSMQEAKKFINHYKFDCDINIEEINNTFVIKKPKYISIFIIEGV